MSLSCFFTLFLVELHPQIILGYKNVIGPNKVLWQRHCKQKGEKITREITFVEKMLSAHVWPCQV